MNKFDVYIQTLKQSLRDLGITVPLSTSYEITTLCNLSCEHCYNKNKKLIPSDQLNLDEKKEVISKLKKLGILEITICGGEPFVDKDILLIIEYIKALNLRLIILTNGLLLTTDIINRLNEILDINDIIQISVDDVIIGNISNQRHLNPEQKDTLLKCIREIQTTNINCVANITPTALNESNLIDLIKQLFVCGIKNIGITPYVPLGDEEADTIIPDYKRLSIIEEEVKEFTKLNNINYSGGIEGHVCQSFSDIKVDNVHKHKFNKRKCDASEFNIHVSMNGNIYPCVFMEKEELLIGNIFDPIEKIKLNMKRINDKIKTKLPEKCISCKVLYECGGGCPGLIFDRYGTLNKVDPRAL